MAPSPAPRIRLLATLLAAALAACEPAPREALPQPTAVRVTPATWGPARPPIETTGIVTARDEQRLSFKVGGIVQQVAVREGERVRGGQLLATLDPTEIGAQVTQAGQLAEQAERDLARGEALHADQVIPLEQLENLRTRAGVARAQLEAARFNQRNARIVAPGDGVVLRRLLEEREFAAPGQVVLVLGREDAGHVVRFAVADRHVVALKRGDAVDVRLDALPGRTLRAAVTQIASAADPATGLFEVEARLEAGDAPLVSGLVGRVRLTPGDDGSQLVQVPIGAVIDGRDDDAVVFVVDGKTARRRAVKVAFIAADHIAIASGLAAGEPVVSAGAPYLEDGDPIAIVP